MQQDRTDIVLHMPVIEDYASKSSFVLELGCDTGNGSTRAIARGLLRSSADDKLHIGVDLNNIALVPDLGDNMIEPWWHYVVGDTRDERTLEKVKAIAGDRKADLIFIDTDHTYDCMKAELSLWENLAKDTTIWLFHDTWMLGAYNHMTDAIIQFSESNPQWKYVDLSRENNGLGALFPKSTVENRL